MEHKVEIWNRGDMALEVVTSAPEDGEIGSHILNPGERVAFDAAEGIGIGPCVVKSPEMVGEGDGAVDPVEASEANLKLQGIAT